MANRVISKLSLRIGASSSELRKDLSTASGYVRRFGKQTDAARLKLGSFDRQQSIVGRGAMRLGASLKTAALQMAAMAAAAVGVTAITSSVSRAFDELDRVAKLSRSLGDATESITGFTFAASQTGVSGEAAAKGLRNMVRRIGEAQQGSGEAVDALERLGLSADSLASMTPTQAFAAIAEALQGVGSQAEKNAIAFDLFGRSGGELLNTLALGREGLEAMQRAAEATGQTFSAQAAGDIEAANDAVDLLKRSASGLTNQMAAALAPAIKDVALELTDLVIEYGPELVEIFKQSVPLIRTAAEAFVILAEATIELISRIARVATDVGEAIGSITESLGLGEDGLLAFLSPGAALLKWFGGFGQSSGIAKKAMDDIAAASAKAGDGMGMAAEEADELARQADEAAKATEAAAREMEKWQQIGDRMTESLRTPLEVFEDTIAEASDALKRGVIDVETYRRAVDDAIQQFEESGGATLKLDTEMDMPDLQASVGAAVQGTSSGFEATRRSYEATLQLDRQMRAQAERDTQRNRLLDQMLRKADEINRKVGGQSLQVVENRI